MLGGPTTARGDCGADPRLAPRAELAAAGAEGKALLLPVDVTAAAVAELRAGALLADVRAGDKSAWVSHRVYTTGGQLSNTEKGVVASAVVRLRVFFDPG